MTHKHLQQTLKSEPQPESDYEPVRHIFRPVPYVFRKGVCSIFDYTGSDPKSGKQRFTLLPSKTRLVAHIGDVGPRTQVMRLSDRYWQRTDLVFLPKDDSDKDLDEDGVNSLGVPAFVNGSKTDNITLEGREYARAEDWFFSPSQPEDQWNPTARRNPIHHVTGIVTESVPDMNQEAFDQESELPAEDWRQLESTQTEPTHFFGRPPIEVTVCQPIGDLNTTRKYYIPIEILEKLSVCGDRHDLMAKALQKQPIKIPQSFDVFEMLLRWMTCEKIAYMSILSAKNGEDPCHMDLLMRLYHTAKVFGQSTLQDEVIEALKPGESSLDDFLLAATNIYAKGMADSRFRVWFKEKLPFCLHNVEEQSEVKNWTDNSFLDIKDVINKIIIKGGLCAVDVAEVLSATDFKLARTSRVVRDWEDLQTDRWYAPGSQSDVDHGSEKDSIHQDCDF